MTHDMRWPVEFCNRAILLERGHIVAAGQPEDVVAVHEERSARRRAGEQPEPLPPITDESWMTRAPAPGVSPVL